MNRTRSLILGVVLALGLLIAPAGAQGTTDRGGGPGDVPTCEDGCQADLSFESVSLDLGDEHPPCRPNC